MKTALMLLIQIPFLALAIVDGQVLTNGSYRQSVALSFKASTESAMTEVYCSGTLIGPRVVLTAAHCLTSGAKAFKTPTETFIKQTWIYVGDSVPGEQQPQTRAQYAVSSAIFYPPSDSVYSDLAMLILKDEVDLDFYQIAPAPMAIATQSMVGRPLTHVGFGMSENNGVKGTKAFFTLPLLGLNAYNGLEVGEMRKPGPSACNGDSGGSAYLHDHDGNLKFIGVENSISNRPCGQAATYFVPITPEILQWIRTAKMPLFE